MSRTVDFYFDLVSPWSYLAHTQIDALAARHKATVNFIPALLGGIFKQTGNHAPIEVPAKGGYMLKELMRFAQLYDVPFKMNAKFPMNTVALMRGALVAQREGILDAYRQRLYRAVWAENVDVTNMEIVADLLAEIGADVDLFMAGVQEPAIKQKLFDNTAEAVARGAFGMPTFFVGEEMFFGQDRLQFVEMALEAQDAV